MRRPDHDTHRRGVSDIEPVACGQHRDVRVLPGGERPQEAGAGGQGGERAHVRVLRRPDGVYRVPSHQEGDDAGHVQKDDGQGDSHEIRVQHHHGRVRRRLQDHQARKALGKEAIRLPRRRRTPRPWFLPCRSCGRCRGPSRSSPPPCRISRPTRRRPGRS